MLTNIAYFGLAMGTLFTLIYALGAPSAFSYALNKDREDPSTGFMIYSWATVITGLLNVTAMVIMVLFSFKLLTVLFGLLFLANSITEVVVNNRKKKAEIEEPKQIDLSNLFWLTFFTVMIFNLVFRTLPFIVFLYF